MRDYLAVLEAKGMLRRISRPVDRNWEPAALAKWVFHGLPAERRFGMYFQKVKGSDIPIVTGALGANTAVYATALGVEPDGINDALVRSCRNSIAPTTVDKAACQEVVITGKELRLSYLPIPVWTPGKDKGPYLTTITLTRDYDTGIQNLGVYCTMAECSTITTVRQREILDRVFGHYGIEFLSFLDGMIEMVLPRPEPEPARP